MSYLVFWYGPDGPPEFHITDSKIDALDSYKAWCHMLVDGGYSSLDTISIYTFEFSDSNNTEDAEVKQIDSFFLNDNYDDGGLSEVTNLVNMLRKVGVEDG